MAEADSYWDTYPDTLTVADTATILRLTPQSVFSGLKKGRIPAHQIAGSWIIFKLEIRAWLESTSNHAASPVPAAVDVLAGYDEELTYRDLMVLFHKTKQTIYTWLHTGEITGFHIGNRWIIHKAQLRHELERSSNQHSATE